jgi:hypothetical protein
MIGELLGVEASALGRYEEFIALLDSTEAQRRARGVRYLRHRQRPIQLRPPLQGLRRSRDLRAPGGRARPGTEAARTKRW